MSILQVGLTINVLIDSFIADVQKFFTC